MGLLDLLFGREMPVVEFDRVIDEHGQIWKAFTDENGKLIIDTEDDVYVIVEAAIVGDQIYPAWIEDDDTLTIDM